MNHNGSRREREIAELARLLPVPDGRDLPAGREQILKEHLMTELCRPHTASRAPIPYRDGNAVVAWPPWRGPASWPQR